MNDSAETPVLFIFLTCFHGNLARTDGQAPQSWFRMSSELAQLSFFGAHSPLPVVGRGLPMKHRVFESAVGVLLEIMIEQTPEYTNSSNSHT